MILNNCLVSSKERFSDLDISREWLTEELRRKLEPQGHLPADYAVNLEPALLQKFIAAGYTPGLGSPPCPTREAGIKKLGHWLYHEIHNRLDESCTALVTKAVDETAALASLDLADMSAPELRAALACILSGAGFPALSHRFANHNDQVDHFTCKVFLTSDGRQRERPLTAWLRLLAAANLLEVWPSAAWTRTTLESVRRAAIPTRECHSFLPLAKRLEHRLRAGAPLGLVTDNHSEAVLDMLFLNWVAQRWGVRTVLFAKACPVETDIDCIAAEVLCRHYFPGLAVQFPAGGSRTLGNLLPRLGRPFVEELLRIQAESGILLVKGIANLQTMPGILIESIFLFAMKSPTLATMFGTPQNSLTGLWLPPGADVGDLDTRFVYCVS